MDNTTLKDEIFWFSGTLVVFFLFLLTVGSPGVAEITIVLFAFILSWVTVRYSIIKFGVGKINGASIKKELKWFAILLVSFLVIITLMGPPSSFEFILVTIVFSLIWIVRSTLIKVLSPNRCLEDLTSE